MRLLTYARSHHRAVVVTLGPIALWIVLGLCGTTWAQCITQETAKLLASDGAVDDFLGVSVAISGDVAIVGAYGDDDHGTNSGSAYVYRFDGITWVEEQKLLASDGAAGDEFGNSVAISDDVAIVGAPFHDHIVSASGSAYVYRFDGMTWAQEQKLFASDGAAGDLFGFSVAISGDAAIVGAPLDNDNGFDSGSAYVYRFDGISWAQEQELLASDGAAADWFGFAVAISGDVAIVGAWRDDDNGSDSGSAYVYRFGGISWAQEQKLLASDGAAADRFGHSVAISGDVAIVGAVFEDDNGPDSGSAYVFEDVGVGCLADLDCDGLVGILDLLSLLAAWGTDPGGPPDFDGDGTVGILDLLTLLANWGPCA